MTFPGGAHDNRGHFGDRVRFADGLEEWQRLLCFSPETSGGLLMAVPRGREAAAITDAEGLGLELWGVGEIAGDGGGIDLLL